MYKPLFLVLLVLLLIGMPVFAQGDNHIIPDAADQIVTLVIIRGSATHNQQRTDRYLEGKIYAASSVLNHRYHFTQVLQNPFSLPYYQANEQVYTRVDGHWVGAGRTQIVDPFYIDLATTAITNLQSDTVWYWDPECAFSPTALEAGLTLPHFEIAYITQDGHIGWLMLSTNPPPEGYYSLHYDTSTAAGLYCAQNKPQIEVTQDQRHGMFFDSLELGADGHPHPANVFSVNIQNVSYQALVNAIDQLYQ